MKTLNFRMPTLSAQSMISEGITDFYNDRRYYEGRPQYDFSGIYKILALPNDMYGDEPAKVWKEMGEDIFRISIALKYVFGDVYDNATSQWIPITKWDDIKNSYSIAESISHIKEVMKKQKARSHAKSIGLTYWPGLIDWKGGCDSRALVAAEDVLSRIHGSWGKDANDMKNPGGWDSYGHHGVSVYDVKMYWFASGCKDSSKFKAQLRTRVKALKSESVTEFMNYVRGYRWIEARTKYMSHIYFSRKAVIALGRLSPELRSAAVLSLKHTNGNERIRIRDLNWEQVKNAQAMLLSGNVKVRAALSGKKRAAQLLGCSESDSAVTRALMPQYSNISVEFAKRLVLGAKPIDLSNGLLNGKEAHSWLTHDSYDFMDATDWYSMHYELPQHRSLVVLKWLKVVRDSKRWDALTRERQVHAPGRDEPIHYNYIGILDEVQDIDILTGKDSVQAVFERAAERNGEKHLAKMMGDYRILRSRPAWAKNMRSCVTYLNTPDALVKEGADLKHCVGGYAHAVEKEQCHILSIRTRHGRSTVELTNKMDIRQHRSEKNAEPPQRHAQWLRAFINRYHAS